MYVTSAYRNTIKLDGKCTVSVRRTSCRPQSKGKEKYFASDHGSIPVILRCGTGVSGDGASDINGDGCCGTDGREG